jgi:hypothetical protein
MGGKAKTMGGRAMIMGEGARYLSRQNPKTIST